MNLLSKLLVSSFAVGALAASVSAVSLPTAPQNKSDAYLLCDSDVGVSSGFTLDRRGGLPYSPTAGFSGLFDDSTENGMAIIRHFNKITTGIVRIDTRVSFIGDGGVLALHNDADEEVFVLETRGGKFCVKTADGYKELCEVTKVEGGTSVRLVIDVDRASSYVVIDGETFGGFALLKTGSAANLLNFRYATTDEGTASVIPKTLLMTVNYAEYENFDRIDDGGKPFDFECSGNAMVYQNTLMLAENQSVTHHFDAVSGDVVAEFEMLLPMAEHIRYTLKSGDTDVLVFTTEDDAFLVNDKTVYEKPYKNIWYRVRVEASTKTHTAVIKLNGRQIGTASFLADVGMIDGMTLINTSMSAATFDRFRVFETVEHADYVPKPVVPAGEENYNVGMNVCPMWRNGTHRGWGCITPYDDAQPVLGYYDEENPETADWEIKYLVEHGVDFQAFCIFFSSGSGPQDISYGGSRHLFEGFMNAKYSDMSHFAIMWEAANSCSPDSMEAWKNDYVPYMIENFFKDPRYMKIDNRLPMFVFGEEAIAASIGGADKMRAMFDYLEQEVQKLGFDGMIYSACGGVNETNFMRGFDAASAYSWGTGGYTKEANINSNTSSASRPQYGYFIPTISVGFTNYAWSGSRFPIMTGEDYDTVCSWVKNTYFTTYPMKNWQRNLVMLSTWNEYGEGTYIMPTTDEKGFQYLDAIRKYFTDAEPDENIDIVPTDAQKERITHLYPQYLRELHAFGSLGVQTGVTSLHKFDFAGKVLPTSSVMGSTGTPNGFSGVSSTNDPITYVNLESAGKTLDVSVIPQIAVTIRTSVPSTVEIFYTTTGSPGYSQSKSTTFSVTTKDFETHIINTDILPGWRGELTGLRIDPARAENVEFTLQSVELFTDYQEGNLSKYLTVNEMPVDLNFAPYYSGGDVLVAFDPRTNMQDYLCLYHEWDRDSRTLTLHSKEHDFIFTIGKNTCTVDGETKTLPYSIPSADGLPEIPLNLICDVCAYGFDIDEAGKITVVTPDLQRSKTIVAGRKTAQWEFNTPGDIEGWTGPLMSIRAEGETLNVSTSYNDPYLISPAISVHAKQYNKIELSMKYAYEKSWIDNLQVFFSTDKGGFSEARSFVVHLESTNSGDEFQKIVIDCTKNPEWQRIITGIRVDVFDAPGSAELDYIRLIPDENYDPSTDIIEEDKPKELTAEDKSADISEDDKHYLTWGFHKEGNAEKWIGSGFSLKPMKGYLEITSDSYDPILYSPEVDLYASEYTELEIRLKYKYEAKDAHIMQIFFTTQADESWSEDKSYSIGLKSTDSGEGYETYKVSLAGCAGWKGVISRLRVDPFNAEGVAQIDYIRLKQK